MTRASFDLIASVLRDECFQKEVIHGLQGNRALAGTLLSQLLQQALEQLASLTQQPSSLRAQQFILQLQQLLLRS
jgi:hypothetical protein